MKEAAERFWDFALSVYGQEAAQRAFLRLQDTSGADVPMLLWCLWLRAEGRGVSEDTMRAALAFTEAWRADAVLPLRTIRRRLKSGIEGAPDALTQDVRARIAKTEQAAERLQMDHLAGFPADDDLGQDAMALYARSAGLSLDADACAVIVAAAGVL